MLIVKEKWDNHNCLTILNFYDEENNHVGHISADITDHGDRKSVFIFNMGSYVKGKGIGTQMIEYLKSMDGVTKINGDIDPDSTGFWLKIGFIQSEDEDEFEYRVSNK